MSISVWNSQLWVPVEMQFTTTLLYKLLQCSPWLFFWLLFSLLFFPLLQALLTSLIYGSVLQDSGVRKYLVQFMSRHIEEVGPGKEACRSFSIKVWSFWSVVCNCWGFKSAEVSVGKLSLVFDLESKCKALKSSERERRMDLLQIQGTWGNSYQLLHLQREKNEYMLDMSDSIVL